MCKILSAPQIVTHTDVNFIMDLKLYMLLMRRSYAWSTQDFAHSSTVIQLNINIAIQLYLSLITNYHKRQEHICYIRNTSNTLQHSAKTETIDNIAYEIIHRKLNRFPYSPLT
jgi:hypothetical protein